MNGFYAISLAIEQENTAHLSNYDIHMVGNIVDILMISKTSSVLSRNFLVWYMSESQKLLFFTLSFNLIPIAGAPQFFTFPFHTHFLSMTVFVSSFFRLFLPCLSLVANLS